MNKLLPTLKNFSVNKTIKNYQGFTLVELLVVITIIAILSVIGMAVFTGVQKNARDARRRADIDSIANAMEVNKPGTTGGNYIALAATQFSSNAIPSDPGSNVYCAIGTANSAPGTYTGTCPTGWSTVASGQPAAGAAWTVCAALENPVSVYCKSNSQ